MKQKILARRYAQATLDSMTSDKYQEILAQVIFMKRFIKKYPKLGEIVRSKVVRNDSKLEFLDGILGTMENKEFWMKIFRVMVLKNRSDIMELFLDEFDNLLKLKLRIKDVKLVLAHKHDKGTLNHIRGEIETHLNSKISYETHIDKSILGGFIAISDNKTVDASVLTSLMRFARKRVKW